MGRRADSLGTNLSSEGLVTSDIPVIVYKGNFCNRFEEEYVADTSLNDVLP